jgi:hypothetical protein
MRVKERLPSRYLKFLPLVALFAFGVVLISLPKGTNAAQLGAPSLSLTNVPLNGTTVVTAMYSDDNPVGTAVLTGSPALGTFVAGATVSPAANDGVETVTVSGASVTVTDDLDTVSTVKTITATFQCTQAGLMTFSISQGGTSPQSVSLICGNYGAQFPGSIGGYYPGYFPGAYNNGYPYTQYPNGAYTTATNLVVAASPASTTCSSPSSISVTVKDSNGNIAPDGTSVTVSASTGTISPNVVSTSGGYATTSFTAPANSNGTATVTAASGQGTGYATVSFSCTGASTTSPASPVYPPTDYPTYAGPAVIMPPNTGDAGLAGNAHTSYAGLALVTLSIIGFGAGAYSMRRQRTEH